MGISISDPDTYKTSRGLYIIAALLEYLISLTITGAYLAKVTSTIGISDSLTGILTSFVSLGTCFQLLAVFIPKRWKVKSYVLPLHLVNQLCFTFLYVIPFFNVSREIKSVLFVVFMLLGHGIANIISPGKVNWLQSFIAPNYRGVFTAKKEIVSLFGGMTFTLIMGNMIDYFEEKGELSTAFIVCALTIFILMISHTLTLFFTKDSDASAPGISRNTPEQKYSFFDMMKDKTLMKISVIFVLFNIAHYSAVPFYGTYQINELGFSLKYVAFLSAVYSVFRALLSRPFGKYADKHSWAKMLVISYFLGALAFLTNVFCVLYYNM
jgi:predicted MFS family arabinose efflux permease